MEVPFTLFRVYIGMFWSTFVLGGGGSVTFLV